MPAIALRQTTWNGLTAGQKQLVIFLAEKLDFGQPARFQAPGGNIWLVTDDPRFELREMAILGVLADNFGLLGAYDHTGKTRAQVRQDALEFVEAQGIVWPAQVDLSGGNPWQAVLTANGAPNTLQAAWGGAGGLGADMTAGAGCNRDSAWA
jgi:hypothetical protein